MPESSNQPTAKKHKKAVRLTFSYDGDKVELISQQPVEMTVPPSDPVEGYEEHKGFWAELKDKKDATLYRRVMHNPTRNDAEVFSADPNQGISRQAAPDRTGVFVVVVPDTAEGHAVTLSSSAPPKGTAKGIRSLANQPASEIARFELKK